MSTTTESACKPKPVYDSDLLLGGPASSNNVVSRDVHRVEVPHPYERTGTGLTVADLWGNSVVVALSAPDAPADPV